jgi:hypothetical protein
MVEPSKLASSPDRKELRSFGLIFGGIVALLFGLILPILWKHELPVAPWLIGAAMGAWSLLAPDTLKYPYKAWMKFGELISKITTPLILSISFFLVVFPVGLVRRIFGTDPLARKTDQSAESYRIASRARKRNDLEKPF